MIWRKGRQRERPQIKVRKGKGVDWNCPKMRKRCFRTHEKAMQRSVEIMAELPPGETKRFWAYQCPHCNWFHLTTKEQT